MQFVVFREFEPLGNPQDPSTQYSYTCTKAVLELLFVNSLVPKLLGTWTMGKESALRLGIRDLGTTALVVSGLSVLKGLWFQARGWVM